MLRRLFGLGPAYPAEVYAMDVENKNAESRETTLTFCMQAQIDKGKTLGFRMSPKLRNTGTTEHRNPLYALRDALKGEQDERIVIRDVERLHYHNELGGDLTFALEHVFDGDPATEVIRKRRDAAMAAEQQAVRVMGRPPPQG
jgi:hypothetical protein